MADENVKQNRVAEFDEQYEAERTGLGGAEVGMADTSITEINAAVPVEDLMGSDPTALRALLGERKASGHGGMAGGFSARGAARGDFAREGASLEDVKANEKDAPKGDTGDPQSVAIKGGPAGTQPLGQRGGAVVDTGVGGDTVSAATSGRLSSSRNSDGTLKTSQGE